MNGVRALAIAALLLSSSRAYTQIGTAFTYQGRLTDGGSPASGSYDFQFALFDAAVGGSQVGPVLTRDDLAVAAGGIFTVGLDFGTVFTGSKRWLEVSVRPGASTGAYSVLLPRQELTPSPNAVFSSGVPWDFVSGKPAGFADGVDNDTMAGLSCASNEIPKWNGKTWACAADANSQGTVTSVTGGSGLSGGTITTSGTLAVNFGGSGAATTAARSDHNHFANFWSGSSGASTGLRVVNTGTGGFSDGIWGQSDATANGRGVVGYATTATGQNYGVWGQTDSTAGRAVFATATAGNGTTYGVYAETASPVGLAVYGKATATSGVSYGVKGETSSPSGYGVFGHASSGSSASAYGVFGQSDTANDGRGIGGRGVFGVFGTGSRSGTFGTDQDPAFNGAGIWGQSVSVDNGAGLFGQALGTSGVNYGVYATTASPTDGYAGFFVGRVNVTGVLSKGGGAFKIDHPLDPEKKYLYHSFVESPDMKNIYDGNIVTDNEGFATVELPDWFEALNRDFRYQLTVIGRFAQAIVAKEIENNRFTILTSEPNVKVSWQVTGIRHDAFAEKHRIPVEQEKTPEEEGTYLYPEAHGRPREQGLDYRQGPGRVSRPGRITD